MAKVLIVGSGAREHALAWKLRRSLEVTEIFVAPGNGGTAGIAQNVPIDATNVAALRDFAVANAITLTVVGPEVPLALGIVDLFRARGLRIFGPTQHAALLETSKAFAKQFMRDNGIPTADHRVFYSTADAAIAHVRGMNEPLVVKADGLAQGKGVFVCSTADEAETAVRRLMIDGESGVAGETVIIEDRLTGSELSVHAITDVKTLELFPLVRDHKKAYDDDVGPNTGGMGAYAPVAENAFAHLRTQTIDIVERTIHGMRRRGARILADGFTGCLFPGIMRTNVGACVLEYNVRFGDPETQVFMRLLDGDLYKILIACADGEPMPRVRWQRRAAVCIVLASKNYPAPSETGFPIDGIEDAERHAGVVVFHGATAIRDTRLVTTGGRVLSVTATGDTLDLARNRAYRAIREISFEGMRYRTDIAARP